MTAEGSIDKLSIEVSSTAAPAVHDIKDLSEALVGLKGSIGKSATKLAEVANGIASIKHAVGNLQLGNLRQLGDVRISGTAGKNIKTMAAAVALMPSDTHSRLAPLASLKALDGVKMSASVGGNLAKIATALTFMPTDTASRLAGLSTLKHLNGVKISSSVPNNLSKLAQAVNAFPADSGTRLSGLAKSLLPLKQLNGMKITTALNGLRELPEVLKKYETLNIKNLVAQLDLLNPKLKELAVSANALKMAFNKMPSSLRTVASATRTVVSANRQLETSQNAVSKSTVSMIGKFGTLNMAFHYLWNGMAKCVHEVNTYIENMNLFQASMGEYTQAATEFGNKVQDAMGIDFGQWARNQGVFQTLITGMGDTAERASVMSQQLTQLGYDISSFYNISVEDAMLKLQSGMAGELEPLRRLGWDLSNARMQLEATKLGIEANVQEMTQAEKVGLRYYLIMNQVTQVHGDMARTIASPANQLRVLQAQVTLAARAVGNLLIPMLNKVLPYAIAAAKAIRMLAQEIASFLGIDANFEVDYSNLDLSGIATGNEGIEDTADAFDDAGEAADKAAKKVKEYKNTVMGFDELNKLNDVPEDTDNDGAGSGAGAGVGDLGGAGFELPLDTYDFLDGLDDYITKLSDGIAEKMVKALKKVLPVVAGIGAGIGAWKIAKALLGNADKLSKLLGKGSDNAGKLATKLKGMRFGGAAASAVRKVELGLMSAAGWLSTIAKFPKPFMAAIAPIAATIAVMVGRTVDLWLNSEKFRDGVKKIWEWLSKIPEIIMGIPKVFEDIAKWAGEVWQNIKSWASSLGIDLSFLNPILNGFKAVADFIGGQLMGVIDALDLDFADLGITVAGLAMVISGVGAPFGIALLAFEAITVAIRAIGWASEDCVESVDALADVSEETAEKFGTSLKSMEDATRELDELDFANSVVTQEDVESIEAKVLDIHDTIVENLNGERNQELAELHSMAGIFTEEEIRATEDRINGYYDDQIGIATSGTEEINRILEAAEAEGRSLTEQESARINEIKDAMYRQLIETSGAAEADLDKIRQAMKNNDETAAVQAASTAIKAAKERADAIEGEAQREYEDTMRWAAQMRDANQITQERYDEIEAAAAAHQEEMVNRVKAEYDQTIAETEEKLGDLKNKIDYNTGEIRSNWDVFCEDVGNFWGDVLGDMKDAYQQWERDVTQGWNDFMSDIGSAWEGLCNDVASWYHSNLEPTINDIQDAFDTAGDAIGRFFSDPVGTIQQAWGDLCNWFQQNVIDPIENAFSWMRIEIPTPKLPDIKWDWTEISGPFGSFSIPNFRIDWYANGGFPTSGQLFMARENGMTEMVGQMGNKSAVANNQQIVEGIEQGVMSAMIQVLPSFQENQGGDVTMILQVGNEQLAKAVNKGNASMARRGQIKPEIQFA